MSSDRDFYAMVDYEDLPSNNEEKFALKVATDQAKIESNSKATEKIYIVKGHYIFVCHKSQLEIRKKQVGTAVLRDIDVRDARMVIYDKDGLRKVDK